MVISECCRLLAATIAATAGQVFHSPESRSDSRAARSCHHPPHPASLLEFASLPQHAPDAEGRGKSVSGFAAAHLVRSFTLISAGFRRRILGRGGHT